MTDHGVTLGSLTAALLQLLLLVAGAPYLIGVMRQVRARLEGRAGAGIGQPWRDLRKQLRKETIRPNGSSWVFAGAPRVLLASTLLVAVVAPLLSTVSPLSGAADIFAVVSLLLLGTVALALAGLDTGTAFGGMGASRAMTVAALAEPTILLAGFALSARVGSSNLAAIVEGTLTTPERVLSPASLLAAVALAVVIVAETGRLPVDNPATHLELTMIHEAMVLEYAGPDLALVELASALRLTVLLGLAANLFLPWGIATSVAPLPLLGAGGSPRRQGRRARRDPRGLRGVRRQVAPVPGAGAARRVVPVRAAGRVRVLLPRMTAYVQSLNLVVGGLLLTAVLMLWWRDLGAIVRLLVVQGVLLAGLAGILAIREGDGQLYGVAAGVLLLKGIALPTVLRRVLRDGREATESEPLVNAASSLLAAAFLILFAYAVSRPLVALAPSPATRALPVGLSMVFLGFFLMISRRRALSQVVGFLLLDNGIAATAFLAAAGVPLIVELGVSLDLFLVVLVLQVLTARMRLKFGSTDLDDLRQLRDS